MPEQSLKEKTAKGLLWGAINNGVQQILVLAFGIILGRLLSPSEYGMVGMLTIFTLIGNSLQESGFRAALVNLKEIRHEDYNAVFWCSTFIGIAAYLILFFCAPLIARQESGFRAALVNLKEIRHEDYNAVFWCSTFIGIAAYLILFFCAPLIARFYGEPELLPLSRYCFLAIPIASLGTVQGAYLFRNLKVRQQAISGILAHIISGCLGVTLAFYGFSYWGIATQSLTYLIVVTLCSWHFSSWRPTLHIDFSPLKPLFSFSSKILCSWHFSSWRPTLHIDFSPLKPLFSFSSKILITNIANQINNNILSVVLGKFFTSQSVGNYNQANKWNATGHQFITGMLNSVAQPILVKVTNIANQINNNILSVVLGKFFTSQSVGNYNQANKWNATGHQFITGMLNSVAQPILVKVRDDQERELRVFRKILRFVAFIAFPAMFGLSTVTRELILITVGEKWTGSISLMQLLCIGGAFIPISTLFSNLIISQGKSNIYMWNIISQVVLQLITVLCIIMMKGSIQTMVIVYVCINIIWLFVWRTYAHRFIGLKFRMLMITVLCIIMMKGSIQTMVIVYVCINIIWLFVWRTYAHRFIGLKFRMLISDLLPFMLPAIIACCIGGITASLIGGHIIVTFIVKILVAAICYMGIMKLSNAEIMHECINYLLKKKVS